MHAFEYLYSNAYSNGVKETKVKKEAQERWSRRRVSAVICERLKVLQRQVHIQNLDKEQVYCGCSLTTSVLVQMLCQLMNQMKSPGTETCHQRLKLQDAEEHYSHIIPSVNKLCCSSVTLTALSAVSFLPALAEIWLWRYFSSKYIPVTIVRANSSYFGSLAEIRIGCAARSDPNQASLLYDVEKKSRGHL